MIDCDEGQEVTDLIVGETLNHTKFVERFERMFVGIKQDVIDLTRREKMQFREFFLGGMIQVNALGDACPIPVVKTKNAIAELGGSGTVETLVDNEIAVLF